MARKLRRETETPKDATRASNVQARKDAIKDGLSHMYAKDREIADAIAEHVAHLRADKAAIRQRLRQEFDISAGDIAACYAAFKAERSLEDDSLGDIIRELFAVVPVGGSVDLVEALETENGEDGKQGAAAADHDHQKAYDEGHAAGAAGKNLATCPYIYPSQKKLKAEWQTGWQAAQEKIAMSLAPKPNGETQPAAG